MGLPRWLLAILILAFVVACQQSAPPGGQEQNRPPVAAFTASPTEGVAPLAVQFDASGSFDPDGVIASYSWDFGDGNTASGVTMSHTFTSPGTFTVVLSVTDNRGATGSAQQVITVTDESGAVPPQASFTATPTSGEAPLTVSFDASASSAPGGSIVSYQWTFGDGSSGSGATTSHTYATPGTFTVVLSVTDNQGLTAQAQQEIEVQGEVSQSEFVAAGVSVPGQKEAIEQESATLGLDAVVTATQLSGGSTLVTSGTLTQAADGSFSYSPSPADRLRIVFNNGATVEYVISALDGDFEAPSIEAFLRRPHVFVYRLILTNGTDLNVSLQRNQSAFQNVLQGTLVSEGIAYNLELVSEGTFRSSVGSAVEYEAESFIQGSISSDAFSATVNERTYFKYFQFENAIEVSERSIDNTWRVGSDQYALLGGFIKRNYFNGRPSEFDLWRAEGTLTRNGAVIGGIGSEFTQFSIDIFLLADGEKHMLYSDLLQ
jgi:PKD repeat protein